MFKLKLLCALGISFALLAADLEQKQAELNWRLLEAISCKNFDVIKQLLDDGANPSTEFYGTSVLSNAVQQGSKDIAILLLQRGAKLDKDILFDSDPEISGILLHAGAIVTYEHIANAYEAVNAFKALSDDDDDIKLSDFDLNCPQHLSDAILTTEFFTIPDSVRSSGEMGPDEGGRLLFQHFPEMMIGFYMKPKALERARKLQKQVNDAIESGPKSDSELLQTIKSMAADSYEFQLILNYLINKIREENINLNSRRILFTLAKKIAVKYESLVPTELGLPIDIIRAQILVPILKNNLVFTDLNFPVQMASGGAETLINIIADEYELIADRISLVRSSRIKKRNSDEGYDLSVEERAAKR